jgi:hypothetical protein
MNSRFLFLKQENVYDNKNNKKEKDFYKNNKKEMNFNSNKELNKELNKKEIECIPSLVLSQQPETSYFSKLTKKQEVVIQEPTLGPGWISISRESPQGKNNIVYFNNNQNKPSWSIQDSMTALVHMHEQRKATYIENYGMDEWEHMFQFPNWREEKQYLNKMEELFENYSNDEYEEDYNEYNDYEYNEYNKYYNE